MNHTKGRLKVPATAHGATEDLWYGQIEVIFIKFYKMSFFRCYLYICIFIKNLKHDL